MIIFDVDASPIAAISSIIYLPPYATPPLRFIAAAITMPLACHAITLMLRLCEATASCLMLLLAMPLRCR